MIVYVFIGPVLRNIGLALAALRPPERAGSRGEVLRSAARIFRAIRVVEHTRKCRLGHNTAMSLHGLVVLCAITTPGLPVLTFSDRGCI